MKKSRKQKETRTVAKKAVRAPAKSTRRDSLKSRGRKQGDGRQPVVQERALLASGAAVERSTLPYLFWPALPFAMMNMWWRAGEALRRNLPTHESS